MIDYTPLSEKKPKAYPSDMPHKIGGRFATAFGSLLVFFPLFIILNISMAFVISLVNGAGIPTWVIPIYYIMGLIGIIWLVNKYVIQSTRYMVRLHNFAVKNGYSFEIAKMQANQAAFKGVLGRKSNAIRVSSLIEGVTPTGLKFSFYNLNKFTRKGYFIVFEVQLNGNYPHIVLDSKINNTFTSNIAFSFQSENKLELQSPFNRYFDVYSKTTPTLTLQVVEPTLMQSLIDKSQKVDVEIVEDKLYLLTKFDNLTSLQVQYLFEAADDLARNIDRAPITSAEQMV